MFKKIISLTSVLYLGTMLSPVVAGTGHSTQKGAATSSSSNTQATIGLIGSIDRTSEEVSNATIEACGRDGIVTFLPVTVIERKIGEMAESNTKRYVGEILDLMVAADYRREHGTTLDIAFTKMMNDLKQLEAAKAKIASEAKPTK